MAQGRACLARIVVAIMAEVYDPPADLRLQASRGPDLGHEEPPREEAAGLLAERDDRLAHLRGGAPHGPPPPPTPRAAPGTPGAPPPPPPPPPAAARGGGGPRPAPPQAVHAGRPRTW